MHRRDADNRRGSARSAPLRALALMIASAQGPAGFARSRGGCPRLAGACGLLSLSLLAYPLQKTKCSRSSAPSSFLGALDAASLGASGSTTRAHTSRTP